MAANRLALALATCLAAFLAAGPRSLPAEDSARHSATPDSHAAAPGGSNPAASPSPPAAAFVDAAEARGVLGRAVRDPEGAPMGQIIDVIVDPAGHVLAAVIDFGGFLGVGSRKIAVDWSALNFGRAVKQGDHVTLTLTPDELKQAPEYRDGKPVVIVGSAAGLGQFDLAAPTASEK